MKATEKAYSGGIRRTEHLKVQSKHLLYFLLLSASIMFGLLSVYLDTVLVIALILAIIVSITCLVRPMVGLTAFVILSFLRPADMLPVLEVIPLAKIVGGLTLLAIILRYITTRKIVFGNRQMLLLLAFLATLFISIPFSYWPSESLAISIDFLKIIIFYFTFVNIIKSLSALRTISLIALVSIIIISISTTLSYFSGNARGASAIGAGLYGDANDVALIMVTAIPLAGFWEMRRSRGRTGTLLKWVTITILIVGIISTGSRGGFLGMVAVLFLYLLSGRNKIVGAVVIVLIALPLVFLIPSNITQRYSTIGTYEEDASAMGRIYSWQAGLHMMTARPLNGVGAGCFEIAFGLDFRPAGFNSAKWNAPHNTLIQVGGETGLIGMSVFLYLYILCISQLRKLKPIAESREQTRIEDVKKILITSLIGFGVCAFFLTQAFNFMYYFLVASTVSLYNLNSGLQKKPIVRTGNETFEENIIL